MHPFSFGPVFSLVAPAGHGLGGLGLVAVDVCDFALAVDDLDAALFELGDGVALHLGARRAASPLAAAALGVGAGRRGGRVGGGGGAAGLAHALLVAAAAAGAVLARHLGAGEGHAALGDDLVAGCGAGGAGLVHLLGGHAAALAGDGLGGGGLGVLHGDGGDVGDDADGGRGGLGPVVPAREGVEARADVAPHGLDLALLALELLVRLGDVAVRVCVLGVLLLVHLGEALFGARVVELGEGAAPRPLRHAALDVGPAPQHLVELLREDAPLDELLDALADLGRDDGHGLAHVLKVEVLLEQRVHRPVGGLRLARQRPLALGHRRRLELPDLLGELGLPPLVRRPPRLGVAGVHVRERPAIRVLGVRPVIIVVVVKEVAPHVGHGALDVLLRGLRGPCIKFGRLPRPVALALPRRWREKVLVVDLVCVQVSRLVLGVLVHALFVALTFGCIEGHVAKRRAVLFILVVIVVGGVIISRFLLCRLCIALGRSQRVGFPVNVLVVAGLVCRRVAAYVLVLEPLGLLVEVVDGKEAVVEAIGVFIVFLLVVVIVLFLFFRVLWYVLVVFVLELALESLQVFLVARHILFIIIVFFDLRTRIVVTLFLLVAFFLGVDLKAVLSESQALGLGLGFSVQNNVVALLQLVEHILREPQHAADNLPRLLPHLSGLEPIDIHLAQLKHVDLVAGFVAGRALALPALLEPALLLLADAGGETFERVLDEPQRLGRDRCGRLQEGIASSSVAAACVSLPGVEFVVAGAMLGGSAVSVCDVDVSVGDATAAMLCRAG
ncbi:Beta-1,2-xylosyltransferase 1 [Purpureocillium lavendulum]|uniref:Beta-1,2-xylosyltransferase 1 n=1 Tax=Purpureocillium lavendulum TaxID=1247861 RepID=A0AB34FYJ3_9HYPO|nr:Beta-1,2-xylosyltransferase 1 [Purpureocillium lavendulum]